MRIRKNLLWTNEDVQVINHTPPDCQLPGGREINAPGTSKGSSSRTYVNPGSRKRHLAPRKDLALAKQLALQGREVDPPAPGTSKGSGSRTYVAPGSRKRHRAARKDLNLAKRLALQEVDLNEGSSDEVAEVGAETPAQSPALLHLDESVTGNNSIPENILNPNSILNETRIDNPVFASAQNAGGSRVENVAAFENEHNCIVSSSGPAPNTAATTKDLHTIWQGNLAFQPKPPPRVKYSLTCTFSSMVTSSGDAEVNADTWPSRLVLQVIPRELLAASNLFSTLKTAARRVLIHFSQQTDALNELCENMSSGMVGCIQFPLMCNIRIMVVLYMPEKQIYMGFIAHDQEGYFNSIKQIYETHSKQQQQRHPVNSLNPNRMNMPGVNQINWSTINLNQLVVARQQNLMPNQGPNSNQSAVPSPAGHHHPPNMGPQMAPSPAVYGQSPNRQIAPSPTGGYNVMTLGATSPGSALNTPIPPGAASSPLNQLAEAACYLDKRKQLSKFIEPLKKMIAGIDKDENKKETLIRMENQLCIISNPNRRFSMDVLLRCEQVLKCCMSFMQDGHMPTSQPQAIPPNTQEQNAQQQPGTSSSSALPHPPNHLPQASGPSSTSHSQQPGTSRMADGDSSVEFSLSQKLIQFKACEVFPSHLVKKVMQEKSFQSADELCDAILTLTEEERNAMLEPKSEVIEDNRLLCKICFDEEVSQLFEPCRHLATCVECAKCLKNCPICRCFITKKNRIYL